MVRRCFRDTERGEIMLPMVSSSYVWLVLIDTFCPVDCRRIRGIADGLST